MNRPQRVALVTGGAVRIGRAISEHLAARGWGVVIHYHRSADAARALRTALQAQGHSVWTVQGPLASQADAEKLMAAATRQAGPIDLLVNNAAIFKKQSLREAGQDAFEQMWRVNTLAPVMLTRAFAAHRGDRRGGAVVNLLDRRIAGDEAGCLPYLLSKQTLAHFTRSAALELAPPIRVNAIAPGAILPPPGSGASVKDLAGDIPLDRDCPPEEVAKAVEFLAEAETVTGQILFIDGGQHLCG